MTKTLLKLIPRMTTLRLFSDTDGSVSLIFQKAGINRCATGKQVTGLHTTARSIATYLCAKSLRTSGAGGFRTQIQKLFFARSQSGALIVLKNCGACTRLPCGMCESKNLFWRVTPLALSRSITIGLKIFFYSHLKFARFLRAGLSRAA